MYKLVMFLVLMISLLPIQKLKAEPVNIGAVVNDDAISDYDINSRIKFVLGTSNIPDVEENRENIKEQVINLMINEKLKKQEAAKLGIKNTEEEIDDAVKSVERQNNLPEGGVVQKFAEMGLPLSILRDQLDADLLWIKVVHSSFGDKVKVSDDEVKDRLAKISEDSKKDRLLLAEIFIAVNSENDVETAKNLADEVLASLRAGASFNVLAQQFSSASSAKNGGDMGWVVEGDLDKEIENAIAGLPEGSLTEPIRTKLGYHIILVRAIHKMGQGASFELAKITVPNEYKQKNPDYKQELLKASSCEAFLTLGQKIFPEGAGNLGELTNADLPDEVNAVLKDLPELKLSAPVSSDTRDVFFMICKKAETNEAELPSEEQVRAMMRSEKLEKLSVRRLQELRNSAILERRGDKKLVESVTELKN